MGQRISRDLAARGVVGRCGIRVAHGSAVSRPVLLIAAATTLLMGCILRDFDYEPPPNSPPSVESLPLSMTPLGSIHVTDLTQTPGGDGGIPNEISFEAEVRDMDVSQPLEGRVFLGTSLIREIRPIPAEVDSPDPRRRTVSFSIPRSRIPGVGCYPVELLVTSANGFEPFPSRNPLEPGDIGSGLWWIAVGQTSDAPPDTKECTVAQ